MSILDDRATATMEATDFLERLWGADTLPDHLRIQLWRKAVRRSSYFDRAAAAAAAIATDRDDVYTAVSLSPGDLEPSKRCTAVQSAGIAGLWADIDVNGPNKTGAAPDIGTAAELLGNAMTGPTLVIHSGHGLQAWWLFEDGPWIFENDDDRERAATLAASWTAYIRSRAKHHGFGIDATQDLARLMRVPGTVNCKGDDRPPVTGHKLPVGEQDGPLHSIEVLEALARSTAATPDKPPAIPMWPDWNLSQLAEPPAERMAALLTNSPKFRQTWEHKRAVQGWTLSEYDLSLASQAADGGWAHKEIAALVIAHRRRYGTADDVRKGMRLDYLRRTIGKACEESEPPEQILGVEPETSTSSPETAGPHDDDPIRHCRGSVVDEDGNRQTKTFKTRGQALAWLRVRLNTPDLVSVKKHGRGKATYTATFSEVDPANLGPNPHDTNTVISGLSDVNRAPQSTKEWNALAVVLRAVAVVDDRDEEAEETHEWVYRYVSQHAINDRHEAARRRSPFVEDDQVHVNVTELLGFVRRYLGERIDRRQLQGRLRAIGYERCDVHYDVEDSGERRRQRYYRGSWEQS